VDLLKAKCINCPSDLENVPEDSFKQFEDETLGAYWLMISSICYAQKAKDKRALNMAAIFVAPSRIGNFTVTDALCCQQFEDPF